MIQIINDILSSTGVRQFIKPSESSDRSPEYQKAWKKMRFSRSRIQFQSISKKKELNANNDASYDRMMQKATTVENLDGNSIELMHDKKKIILEK